MKLQKSIAIIGASITIFYAICIYLFFTNVYGDKAKDFMLEKRPVQVFLPIVIYVMPALFLFFKKELSKRSILLAKLYPFFLIFALFCAYLATTDLDIDMVTLAMPIILITYPFCLISSIVFYADGK
jgi:hypothetical protein